MSKVCDPHPAVTEIYIESELLAESGVTSDLAASLLSPSSDRPSAPLPPPEPTSSPPPSTSPLSSQHHGSPPQVQSLNEVNPASPPKKRQRRTRNKQAVCTSNVYVVKFKGNGSKKWDGKDITVDAEWLEELYKKSELCPGRIVEIPFSGKGGTTIGWRVMIVGVPTTNDGKYKAIHECVHCLASCTLMSST